jgi:hypothetical protein
MPGGCDQKQKAITHLSCSRLQDHLCCLNLNLSIEALRFACPSREPERLLDIGRHDFGDCALESHALSGNN